MKLTEKDLQNACEYVIDEICKATYGSNYKEKGFSFDRSTPNSIRTTIEIFIEWLKIRASKK